MRVAFAAVFALLFVVGQAFGAIHLNFDDLDTTSGSVEILNHYAGVEFGDGVCAVQGEENKAHTSPNYVSFANTAFVTFATDQAGFFSLFYAVGSDQNKTSYIDLYSKGLLIRTVTLTAAGTGTIESTSYIKLGPEEFGPNPVVFDQIKFSGSGTDLEFFFFDDFDVKDASGGEVPEPATLAMWSVLSLVGVGAWRSRSRRR